MIYRHTQEQVKEYESVDALNQTSIKAILKDGMQSFLAKKDNLLAQDDLYYSEESHFIIGKAVDCLIAHDEDVFEETYHCSRLLKKPGDKVLAIIKMVFDGAKREVGDIASVPPLILHYTKEIHEACNSNQYYMNRAKPTSEGDTRIASVIKEGEDYWNDLINADGKQVLSDSEANISRTIEKSFKEHPYTSYLFQDSEDTDIVFQFPIYWSYKGVDCKGLMDHLVINHRLKRIMPLDEKTIGNYILRFNKQAKKLRYDIQGSYYHFGLSSGNNLENLSVILGRDVTKYSIANFAFVAESTISWGVPLIFPLTNEIMKHGRTGDGENYLGWEQGIEIYKSWADVGFSLTERMHRTNGVAFISNDFEYAENLLN